MISCVYGLGLFPSRPIPRLGGAPSALRADVRIELNARPAWFGESLPAERRFATAHRDASGTPVLTVTEYPNHWVRFKYTDGVDFYIDDKGSEIWVDWQPELLTLDDVSSYLLGPVMGMVLCLRGRTCLHASGVVIDGRAVAFLGPPGAGKSTTAGAFGTLGFGILSDDVIALREADGGFLAYPGYPRLRLWPASLTALSDLGRTVPALPDNWGERRYHLDISGEGDAFQTAPVPLGAIYVVGPRSSAEPAPFVESLTGNQLLLTLVANTYVGRVLNRKLRGDEFDAYSRIAETVRVRRVTPHTDARRLSRLCEVVLDDFRQHQRQSQATDLKDRVGA